MNHQKRTILSAAILLLVLSSCGSVQETEPPVKEKQEEEEIEPEEAAVLVLPPPDIRGFEEEEEHTIVDYPDQEAQFPGGTDAMNDFLMEKIRYPEGALEKGSQGKVYVEFVVKEDGSYDSVKILKGVSKEINEEAIRVVQLMPNWIPAEAKGEPVNARVRIPIIFKLATTNKD